MLEVRITQVDRLANCRSVSQYFEALTWILLIWQCLDMLRPAGSISWAILARAISGSCWTILWKEAWVLDEISLKLMLVTAFFSKSSRQMRVDGWLAIRKQRVWSQEVEILYKLHVARASLSCLGKKSIISIICIRDEGHRAMLESLAVL